MGCVNRDNASLDIFWLRDESLEESDCPTPTFSPKKSSKTSKPPSNNSAKLPLTSAHATLNVKSVNVIVDAK